MEEGETYVPVMDAADARDTAPVTVRANGRSLGLFYHDGAFYATDQRCPHMGFPLTDGRVDDGLLTCPWHHARFELSCGDTLDPFADDVHTYPVEVRDGTVFVDPDPPRTDPVEHWRDRLEHGLEEDLRLVIAKSVIGLDDHGEPATVPLAIGTDFGTTYRAAGWGRGLTTLAVMANLLDDLDTENHCRALTVGLSEVADECSGESPFFVQDPLEATDVDPDRLERWFRDTLDVRDADGAERVLRAAIRAGHDESRLAGMLLAAATDHRYLNAGHVVDFVNKAFDLLDHVGFDRADAVLPSLVPLIADAARAEEQSSWRQPIDVAALIADASDDLPGLVDAGNGDWSEPSGFLDVLLGDDPHAIMDAVTEAIRDGATATELAQAVTDAAAFRVARFGTANEFRDWNTVHHTYSFANAVHGLSHRTDAVETYRGVFDAAMSVYVDRFLNTPPSPLSDPDDDGDPAAVLETLREQYEVESRASVDEAGELVATYLESGGDDAELKRTLGEILLREDAGFHPRQNLEAAFTQYDGHDDPARARVHLVATARFLAAHTPTRRSGEQTYQIAARLHRGETLHETD